MSKSEHKSGRRRAGSRILIEITSMILIIFVVAGIAAFFIFRNSQSRVIQNSKDKLVEYKGKLSCSTSKYVTSVMVKITLASVPGESLQTMADDLANGYNQHAITPVQQSVDGMLQKLVRDEFINSKMALYALPPASGTGSHSIIVMSSDEEDVFKDLPLELKELATMKKSENKSDRERINGRSSFMLFKDGIPDLGLNDEYLVSAYNLTLDPSDGDLWFFNFTSMHDELAAVDSFYKTESGKINNILILLLIVSSAALTIITFIVLSYLIRKNITKPIGELEEAAEKAMEGDLDVKVIIREGEEFEGLKIAFNNMLGSLRMVINRSLGTSEELSESSKKELLEDESGKSGKKKHRFIGRSSILFQATVLVIVIFIVSSGFAMMFFRDSQAKLAEKSRQKIVMSTAGGIDSGFYFVSSLVMQYFTMVYPALNDPQVNKELLKAISEKKTIIMIAMINEALKEYTNLGFDELVCIFEVLPAIPGILDVPTITMATDDKLVFMELPDELLKLHEMIEENNSAYRARIDKDAAYMLVENGLPYLGLKGEYLVIVYNFKIEAGLPITFWFYGVKPMGEQLAEIKSFYNSENRRALLMTGLLIAIGLIAVIIITFFVLDYLIRTRITKPVDELSAITELVMEGDLDVEIPIHKGEEFEGLKTVFNEMLKSLRELLG